jgi:hypothetical protein
MKRINLLPFIFFFLLLSFTKNNCYAQFGGCDFESDNFRSFLYTKLLVVLDGTPKYDEALKQAVKDYWKITPYQFIDISQVDTWINNDRFSFLMPITIEEIRNNDIATYIKRFNYLAVFVGGKNSVKKYDKNDLIAYAPYDNDHLEKEKVECTYRLDLMVKSMHDAITIIQREKMTGNFDQLQDKLIEHYNKKSSTLAKKTMLINADYFTSKFNKTDFKESYPFKFEITDSKTISQYLKTKDLHYIYLAIASTDEKYMFVYNLFSGEIIYANFKVVGEVFNKKEVKNMVKKAG